MKKTIWIRILSVLLIVCMLSTDVSAASFGRGNWDNVISSSTSWFTGLLDQLKGLLDKGNTKPTEPAETEPVVPGVMTLVEDASTVTNGDLLRADTYLYTPGTLAAGDNADPKYDTTLGSTLIKYYPVTMYNYHVTTANSRQDINAVMHQMEVDAAGADSLTQWNGLYFGGNSLGANVRYTDSFTYSTDGTVQSVNPTWEQLINNSGKYFADKAMTQPVVASTQIEDYGYKAVNPNPRCDSILSRDSSDWASTDYFYRVGDAYYPLFAKRATEYFLVFPTSQTYSWGYSETGSSTDVREIGEQEGLTSQVNFTVYTWNTTTAYTVVISGQEYSTTNTNDSLGVTLYTPSVAGTATTKSLNYANYNKWAGWFTSNGSNSGNRVYSGLVENRLDANGNLRFTMAEPGIFTTDSTAYKDVYTNVKMPFVYDSTTGFYTMDANTCGFYFNENATQGSTNAQSNGKLYFDSTPQAHNFRGEDGRKKGWFPFNNTTDVKATASSSYNADHFFGMNAVLPFTMTANGRMVASDNSSEPIKFNFSGDDDVWVFIDNKLVLDMGGVKNMLAGSVDFAANTWSITKPSDNASTSTLGDAAASPQALEGKLFDEYDESGTKTVSGVLGMTRQTFAATENHTLTVFYLERGAGSSNCKIEFNLPVKDNLTVTKQVNEAVDLDKNGNIAVRRPLKPEEKAVVDNMNFGFTLMKDDRPVANTPYVLLDVTGQILATPTTDAYGHFALKNGQTAKFTGEIDNTNGNTYFVKEDVKNGFIYTSFTANAKSAHTTITNQTNSIPYGTWNPALEDGHWWTTKTDEQIVSSRYSIRGGSESKDTLSIVAENFLNLTLPTPSAVPQDDRIVIDYGLPVEVDLTMNDLMLGDRFDITFGSDDAAAIAEDGVYTGNFGTYTMENGKMVYTLTKPLTDVEVIPYTMTSYARTGDGREVSSKGQANVYIIPATTMYYEEDFAGLLTYTGRNWTSELVGAPTNLLQEPGRVGTIGDSPYGSDVAYLDDNGDSNGTSKYADTTDGAVKFEYTFSGTGTSFFARTSATSGFMQVRILDEQGELIYGIYRDTGYHKGEHGLDVVDTLYNIPVFTWNAESYGTYTVSVVVAKASEAKGYGTEFWLDGVRVYNPLNPDDANKAIADAAYATDGESNMQVLTLREKLLTEASLEEVVVTQPRYDKNGNVVMGEDNKPVMDPVQARGEDNELLFDEKGAPIWETKLVPVWNGDGFVIFTDSNGVMETAEEYQSNGPKEEIYLYNGQSISFSLKDWDPNTNRIYLGIKAPTGSGNVTIGGQTLSLSNTNDCYFDLNNGSFYTVSGDHTITFTITAGSGSLISVTNIKVTGDPNFEIVNPQESGDMDDSEGNGN